MESHLKVELRPRIVPAGDAVQAARLNTVERLANLGQLDNPADGTISTEQTVGWSARIGDVDVPVEAYAVSQDEFGAPVLSLVLMPDSISIGATAPCTPSTSTGTDSDGPGSMPSVKVSSWIDGSHPDPRAGLPDYEPEELGGQVADHAERTVLRTWEPNGGQRRTSAFSRLLNGAREATA